MLFSHENERISGIFRQVPVLLKMGNSRIIEFTSHIFFSKNRLISDIYRDLKSFKDYRPEKTNKKNYRVFPANISFNMLSST